MDVLKILGEVKEHQVRVSITSAILMTLLGGKDEQIMATYIAGRLHDTGKFFMPEELLLKPNKLTETEMLFMQRHPELGEDIVIKEGYGYSIAKAVRHHHENFDGTGYPDGLKEFEIPLISRVLRVTDVFDAMREERNYHPSISKEDTLKEMDSMAEQGMLDPIIYGVFKRNVDYIEERLASQYSPNERPLTESEIYSIKKGAYDAENSEIDNDAAITCRIVYSGLLLRNQFERNELQTG